MRLATSLAADGEAEVRLFFIGDGAWCAVGGHEVPDGMHSIEFMLNRFLAGRRRAGVCGTCMDTRGIGAEALIDGTYRSTLDELRAWTTQCGKVLVF